MDISFYNGELYGLGRYSDRLVKFSIGMDKDGRVRITSTRKLNMQQNHCWRDPDEYPRYIVVLHDKLVMVEAGMPRRWSRYITRRCFKVHELVDYITRPSF